MTFRSESTKVLSGTSILIVDDEYLIALDLETIVRDGGADDVVLCTSVEEGLAAIEATAFDLAILDVRLGGETSWLIAGRLADNQVPFLFYSGETLPSELRKSYPDVFQLVKPALHTAVIDALGGLMTKARQAS